MRLIFIKKKLEKTYYSKKLYELFTRMGMSNEDALKAAEDFMDEINPNSEST